MNNLKHFIFYIVISLLFVYNCKAEEGGNVYKFYVGTYTKEKSKGIYEYSLTPTGKLTFEGLAAKSSNPSFLTFAFNGNYLLAVNENEKGTVESFKVDNDTLIRISKCFSGGADPCHIFAGEKGDVLVSNYTSGTLGLLKLDDNGKLSGPVFIEDHNKAGEKAHVHFAEIVTGTDSVISADLGTNSLWFSMLKGDKLVASSQNELEMPENSGPRHLVKYKNRIYAVNEFANTVVLVKKRNHKYFVDTLFSTLPENFIGTSYSAEIYITRDGNFIYTSNRGHNSLSVFKVDKKSGYLKLIDNVPVQGDFPRNFALTPDEKFLVVANQKSDNLVVFSRDQDTGLLKFLSEIYSPVPVCVLFKINN